MGAREDLTPLRSKLLQVMRDSDLVDSVRVSNGKLCAYKETRMENLPKSGA